MKLDKELEAAPKKTDALHKTSRRVRMIFSVMASPNRIDILRILNSKGSVTYSELKALAGFRSKKESGKFAYHLRKLLRQSLVSLNRTEKRYTITNIGKLVLSLARQIEERSTIESGKMYVKTSHESIEEFSSHKVTQFLMREGNMPLELAQKITEETENKLYKYQTSHLSGSLIRDIVNSVLLEHNHEDYRSRLTRFGPPAYDIQALLTDVKYVNNGAERLLCDTGQRVFSEYLMMNAMPKDIVDSHLAGEIHVSDIGLWSLLPDTLFLNLREILEDGMELGGRMLGISRISSIRDADELAAALGMTISFVSREASREVVLDGLIQILLKYAKGSPDLAGKLKRAFVSASATTKFKSPTLVSILLSLDSDADTVAAVLEAYREYARITPIPQIGLVINHERSKISSISEELAEIVSLGGRILLTRGVISLGGITNASSRNMNRLSISFDSLSINLPRLAFESNRDETYFRAKLVLAMHPAFSALDMRRKEISDLVRRGLSPVLATQTQHMQRGSVTLALNLVGLEESVFGILGYKKDKTGREVFYKVIETATDIAKKKARELGCNIKICMIRNDSSARFADLDAEKYGKNSMLPDSDPYTEGLHVEASEIEKMTARSDLVQECTKTAKMLGGNVLVTLGIDGEATKPEIRKALEKADSLIHSFMPIRPIPVCGRCGYKESRTASKCSSCKSAHMISLRMDTAQ